MYFIYIYILVSIRGLLMMNSFNNRLKSKHLRSRVVCLIQSSILFFYYHTKLSSLFLCHSNTHTHDGQIFGFQKVPPHTHFLLFFLFFALIATFKYKWDFFPPV